MILDIGCGDLPENLIPNSHGIDQFDYGQKYVFNIEEEKHWPIESNMYDEIVALHILEHVKDGYAFINIMNEIWRVAKNGAIFRGACPHYTSKNFFRDPSHCRMMSEDSFDMFLKDSPIHAGSGYDIKCTFIPNSIFVNANKDLCWSFTVVK